MALTRKFLTAMGIEADKVDEIINAHVEVVDALKTERDQYKADAEKLPAVQAENEQLKANAKGNNEDSYKVKYEAIKEEFEEFKNNITAKESKAKKTDAYRQLLKDAGVLEKRIDAVMKVSNVDDIEFDEDGKIANADKLTESIKSEWADFIVVKSEKGANVSNPPANNGKATKTYEEIRAIKDPVERQNAMAENPALFGLPESD